MSASGLEAFLAKIYVDERAREEFLADPSGEAAKAGLTQPEVEAVQRIDRVGLALIASSLERKRLKALLKTIRINPANRQESAFTAVTDPNAPGRKRSVKELDQWYHEGDLQEVTLWDGMEML